LVGSAPGRQLQRSRQLPQTWSIHLKKTEKSFFFRSDRIGVARWFIFEPKIQISYILEGLGMENVGVFYGC
jgi:hypothetical protein